MSWTVSLLVVFLVITLADFRHPWEPQPEYADLSLTDVDTTCLNRWNQTQNDDFLIGTWYKIYKFSWWLNLVPSKYCSEVVISRPTAEEVQVYKNKYNRSDAPFNFKNALKMDFLRKYGAADEYMALGSGVVKFVLISPAIKLIHNRGFNLKVLKKINENYLLDVECMYRSIVFWLWTKNRNATDEDLNTVIKGIKDLDTLESQRFCSPI